MIKAAEVNAPPPYYRLRHATRKPFKVNPLVLKYDRKNARKCAKVVRAINKRVLLALQQFGVLRTCV